MTDVEAKKRRLIYVIFAVVILIGIGGVTIAMLSDDSGEAGSGITTTPGIINPLSVQGVCQADRVVVYVVEPTPKKAADFTATSAAEPWLRQGESSQTTSVDDDTKLVALTSPGHPAREVLTVRRKAGGWRITSTTACLDSTERPDACAADVYSTLTFADRVYRATDGAATPGKYVGSAEMTPCVSDGSSYVARGVIAPVSVYQSGTKPAKTALVITEGATNRLFGR